MSNLTTTVRNDYTGNAVTTAFAFTFLAYSSTEITVYVNNVVQTLNTHYSVTFSTSPVVSGTPSTGTVTFIATPAGQASGTPPANAVGVAIIRTAPYTQAYVPTNTGALDAAGAMQSAFDELSFQVQQLTEMFARVPALASSSSTVLGAGSLPTPVSGQFLIGNGTNNGYSNSAGTAGTVAIPTSPALALLQVNSTGTGVAAANLPVPGTGGLIWFVGTTAGTSTAYTYTATPFPAAYVQGMWGVLRMHTTNGAAPTLSISTIGAKAIMYYAANGTATAVAPGDLISGENYIFQYDGTLDKFVILGPIVGSSFNNFYDLRFSALNTLAGELGVITGLALTAAAGTTTLSIATGAAMDSTGVQIIKLGSAFTKLLDAAGTWTAATGGKGNQSASAATTSYHIFLIGKTTDLTAADIFFDTSATAANLAASAAGSAGFNVSRRIGSLKSDGSKNWVVTRSYEIGGGGLRFELDVPVRDFSTANPGTSAVVWTTSIPTGVKFIADVIFSFVDATATARNFLVTSPDQTDSTPSTTIYTFRKRAVSYDVSGYVRKVTSTTATLRYRIDVSDANITVDGVTNGWEDSRR